MAAIGATQDRIYISRYSKGLINEPDTFYNSLVRKSGPASNTLKEKFVSWKKAYKANIEKIEWIDGIKKQFK